MNKVTIKNKDEIKLMQEGGRLLAEIRDELKELVKPGMTAADIDKKADSLIKKTGGKPSFKMVKDYNWATCVNVDAGVVHGIPHPEVVFEEGTIVSVDIGLFYEQFHTDTSFTLDLDSGEEGFLKTGKKAFEEGIKQAKPGNFVFDISKAIEDVLKSNKLSPIWALVGHGIGRDLHEEPQIPCFTQKARENTLEIKPGMVFAIEVMYTKGNGRVVVEDDGWTITTEDDKISALYEETVLITNNGNNILTKAN